MTYLLTSLLGLLFILLFTMSSAFNDFLYKYKLGFFTIKMQRLFPKYLLLLYLAFNLILYITKNRDDALIWSGLCYFFVAQFLYFLFIVIIRIVFRKKEVYKCVSQVYDPKNYCIHQIMKDCIKKFDILIYDDEIKKALIKLNSNNAVSTDDYSQKNL